LKNVFFPHFGLSVTVGIFFLLLQRWRRQTDKADAENTLDSGEEDFPQSLAAWPGIGRFGDGGLPLQKNNIPTVIQNEKTQSHQVKGYRIMEYDRNGAV